MGWKVPVRLRAAVLEPWRPRMVEIGHRKQSRTQFVHLSREASDIIWFSLRTDWSCSPSGPALNVALSPIVYEQFQFRFWTGPREPTPTLVQSLWEFQAHKFLPQCLPGKCSSYDPLLLYPFASWGERSKACGSSITAGGKVQANKAVRQSLSDHLTSEQAGFDAASVSMFVTNCNPAPKKNPKPPKARFVFVVSQISATYTFSIGAWWGWKKPLLKALTPEEKQKKDFQKDLAQFCTYSFKASYRMICWANII